MYVYVSKQVGYVCNEMPKEEKKKSQKERKKLNEWGRRKKMHRGFFFLVFRVGGGTGQRAGCSQRCSKLSLAYQILAICTALIIFFALRFESLFYP